MIRSACHQVSWSFGSCLPASAQPRLTAAWAVQLAACSPCRYFHLAALAALSNSLLQLYLFPDPLQSSLQSPSFLPGLSNPLQQRFGAFLQLFSSHIRKSLLVLLLP